MNESPVLVHGHDEVRMVDEIINSLMVTTKRTKNAKV